MNKDGACLLEDVLVEVEDSIGDVPLSRGDDSVHVSIAGVKPRVRQIIIMNIIVFCFLYHLHTNNKYS